MKKTALTIPKRLTILMLALAALTVPAWASVQYSYCSSGCNITGGSYATWDTGPGSAGLTFSPSLTTFFAANLSSGVYTDPSGAVFTGYSGGSTTPLQVSGSALAQTGAGSATWAMNIALPSNTYAFAMMLSSSSFSNPWVELVSGIANFTNGNANYNIVLGGSGATAFFGVTSDAPLTNIVVGNLNSGNPFTIQSFELGQTAALADAPEASTLVLIGGGLALFGFLRRRGGIQKPHGALA
jgi:hypothetical protein